MLNCFRALADALFSEGSDLKAVDQDSSPPSSHRIISSMKYCIGLLKCTVVLSLRAHGVGISAMA